MEGLFENKNKREREREREREMKKNSYQKKRHPPPRHRGESVFAGSREMDLF